MRVSRASVVLALGLSASGCTDRAPDNGAGWYGETREQSRQRRAFVESHQEMGLSELEAKRAWEHKQMIRNTVSPSPPGGEAEVQSR